MTSLLVSSVKEVTGSLSNNRVGSFSINAVEGASVACFQQWFRLFPEKNALSKM